ncbi:MAG: TlpA family protein disulfide reductase [Gemmatimonadota bacterium]
MAAPVALAGVFVLAWTQRDRFTPVDAGSRAPAFSALTLDGDTFSIEAARGKVIVLNVWATWCAPCLAEMPALERLHQKFRGRPVEVIAVSADLDPAPIEPFVEQLGLTFPVIHDRERVLENRYLVHGLPTTFVIDTEGRIVRRVLGARVWDDAAHAALIEELLSET